MLGSLTYPYSSTQIDVPKDLAEKILDWSYDNVSDFDLNTEDNFCFGREDEIHITILYGLHLSEPKPIKELLKNCKTGNIVLGKMSLFTNDKFDVLKIDIKSDILHKLHRLFDNNLETTKLYEQYIPHITIGYFKKGRANKFIGDASFEGISFNIKDITFAPKNGNKVCLKL